MKQSNIMSKDLWEYLEQRFKRNNHPKYLKYFDEWVSNISETQIHYFEIERLNIIQRSKYERNN